MDSLAEDPINLALTRPAMLFGVPLEIACLLFIVGGLAITIPGNGNPFYGLLVSPFWWLAAVIVRRDYNAIRVAMLWLKTAGTARDGALWGGASMTPLPIRMPAHGRGIPVQDGAREGGSHGAV
jgi:type IV secretion system protein VirB3